MHLAKLWIHIHFPSCYYIASGVHQADVSVPISQLIWLWSRTAASWCAAREAFFSVTVLMWAVVGIKSLIICCSFSPFAEYSKTVRIQLWYFVQMFYRGLVFYVFLGLPLSTNETPNYKVTIWKWVDKKFYIWHNYIHLLLISRCDCAHESSACI